MTNTLLAANQNETFKEINIEQQHLYTRDEHELIYYIGVGSDYQVVGFLTDGAQNFQEANGVRFCDNEGEF